MRTITFKKERGSTDPVNVGDILRIRKGNKWYTVIAVNEAESSSCEECLFYDGSHCNAPYAGNNPITICSKAKCVFKDLNKVMENL